MKISHLLIDIEGVGLLEIRKRLRRDKAIELLGKGLDPRDIMFYVFKLSPAVESNGREFFSQLFGLSFDKL